MTVSKRVRFEVLRRDQNACQYCGSVAPDVVLTIDHVIPIALGGSDDVGNLVAACKDCNAGKTSISPDSPLVAAVSARSAEFAAAQANVASLIRADMEAIRDYCDEFETAWKIWGSGEGDKRVTVPLATDWRRSLRAWWRMSVPVELLIESIPAAMTSTGRNHTGIAMNDRFRYFCGVVWRTLEQYDATYPDGSNKGRIYSGDEREDYGVEQWAAGYEAALKQAEKDRVAVAFITHGYMRTKESSRDLLRHHIDGTTPPAFAIRTFASLAGVS